MTPKALDFIPPSPHFLVNALMTSVRVPISLPRIFNHRPGIHLSNMLFRVEETECVKHLHHGFLSQQKKAVIAFRGRINYYPTTETIQAFNGGCKTPILLCYLDS